MSGNMKKVTENNQLVHKKMEWGSLQWCTRRWSKAPPQWCKDKALNRERICLYIRKNVFTKRTVQQWNGLWSLRPWRFSRPDCVKSKGTWSGSHSWHCSGGWIGEVPDSVILCKVESGWRSLNRYISYEDVVRKELMILLETSKVRVFLCSVLVHWWPKDNLEEKQVTGRWKMKQLVVQIFSQSNLLCEEK